MTAAGSNEVLAEDDSVAASEDVTVEDGAGATSCEIETPVGTFTPTGLNDSVEDGTGNSNCAP